MLQKKAAAGNGEQYRFCSLVLDAMSIRQQIQFDPGRKKFSGYVDLRHGDNVRDIKKAK